jgi:hypothetical protein
MKWSLFGILFAFSFGVAVFADDTLVVSSGDTLHPIKSIDIKMQKEVLMINYGPNNWTVDVEYEFFNAGLAREEQIAFVSANMTYSKNDNRYSSDLGDFSTLVNGEKIEAQKKADKENDQDFYLYKMRFNKGINYIKHHYSLMGAYIFNPLSRGFFYKLTTGGNWAGGNIGDLKITVNLPVAVFVTQYNKFFTVDGTCRLGQSNIGEDENPIKYTFINNGNISFLAQNYTPQEDIHIEIEGTGIVLRKEIILVAPAINMQMLIYGDLADQADKLKNLNKQQLSLLRNAIYAWHGYSFKNAELTSFFSKYAWYIPLEAQEIELSTEEKNNVDLIRKIENSK